MKNIKDVIKYKKIYFIGIGGVSMSGIAHTLQKFGFDISGSDTSNSDTVQSLIDSGINVYIGHYPENIKGCELVVYTAAIADDDPELMMANSLNIPTMERAVFLGLLTKCFDDTITISGTHGKTTTTSMISLCFLKANLNPSIQVGAYLKNIEGNYVVGNSEYFILEACEYVESFLHFFPKASVILNIDNDHLDYFKNIDNIKTAFRKYAMLLPKDGVLVTNADDYRCLEIAKSAKSKVITYGIENLEADYTAKNIEFDDNGFPSFDVYYKNSLFTHIRLSIPGQHNVLNALACIAMCSYYNIDCDIMKLELYEFTGADRRMQFKGVFNKNINVFDDYAHHPTEIRATALGIKNKKYNQSWVIFQPHTYSRTKELLNDFAEALLNFDNIIITDIYAAREKDIYKVSSLDLVNKINEINNKAIYIKDFKDIVEYLKQNAKDNDIVITLGAGTVTEIGPMLTR